MYRVFLEPLQHDIKMCKANCADHLMKPVIAVARVWKSPMVTQG